MNCTNNTIGCILYNAKMLLKNSKIETYSLDAEILLCYLLNVDRIMLVINNDMILSNDQIEEYNKLINRRLLNEPIAYITNKSEFMGIDFYVNNNVLIPRPETETLVELVIDYIGENKNLTILDMCTGSGCIPISLSKYCNNLNILALDISEDALNIAKKNDISNSIYFFKSDMFKNIPKKYKNNLDIIISNPPYIETSVIDTLGENVKKYEPIIALDGKEDGLFFYREISNNAKYFLKPKGIIFLEIGYNQAQNVKNIFLNNGFSNISIKKDLSGLDRIVVVSR